MNRRIKMTDMVGDTIYGYDELNRLTSLTDPANRSFAFSFDAGGRPASSTFSNGITAAISHDAADQLLNLTYSNSNSAIASRFVRSRSGNVILVDGAREDGNTRTFGYDQVDRTPLISEFYIAYQPKRKPLATIRRAIGQSTRGCIMRPTS
jgi:YD repeat-containing protein